MNLPLEGLRVVELATYVAAPTCGKLLADLGAQVIKVEAPQGDAWRYSLSNDPNHNPRFDLCNGGKKSVVLDLKTDGDRRALETLIAGADIFLTNTRPKSLHRLGLSHDALRERYPSLIYAAITGYGEQGPEADLPGFDTVAYWARSGFMTDMSISTGQNYPVDTPVGVGDSITGMALYASILAALLQRQQTGLGDYVTVSLFNMGIWAAGGSIILSQYPGVTFPRTREQCFPESAAYRCADGEWVQLCIMEFDRYGPALFRALGYPDLLKDPRYASLEKRMNYNGELVALAEKAFRKKTAEQWVEELSALDIVCCRMPHFSDVPNSRQAWANGYLERLEYPDGRNFCIPCSPIRLGSRGVCHLSPAPALGADTEMICSALWQNCEDAETSDTQEKN